MSKPDFYISHVNTVQRLIKEWKQYGQLIVAFDFDGTVHDFHDEGHSYKQVIELLRRCKKMGAYLIVYSVSKPERYPYIREYLEKNGIPYDAINENKPGLDFTSDSGKIYYNILLDDRAGLASAVKALNTVLYVMEELDNDN